MIPPSAILLIKVVPGASRDRVVGRLGPALKIQVTAMPEAGKANRAAARLLAELFALKPSDVQLISGAGTPRKRFQLTGISDQQLQQKMAEFS
jgi:uncharacterized protein YggU (UPF0235/DUF167 family)